MIYHSINQIVSAVAHVVGEDDLAETAKLGAYWSSCFWRARKKHPIYYWAYHEMQALNIWRYHGRAEAERYLHENGIYD